MLGGPVEIEQNRCNHPMTCLIFAEYSPGIVDAVISAIGNATVYPQPLAQVHQGQSWAKPRAEFMVWTLHFVPLLFRFPKNMSNWENRKWALIQLRHMLPFMLWSRILVKGKTCPSNQHGPDSDEAVIVTFIKSEHFLARSRVPFCALPPQPRGDPGSQGHHLSLNDFSRKGYIFFA